VNDRGHGWTEHAAQSPARGGDLAGRKKKSEGRDGHRPSEETVLDTPSLPVEEGTEELPKKKKGGEGEERNSLEADEKRANNDRYSNVIIIAAKGKKKKKTRGKKGTGWKISDVPLIKNQIGGFWLGNLARGRKMGGVGKREGI